MDIKSLPDRKTWRGPSSTFSACPVLFQAAGPFSPIKLGVLSGRDGSELRVIDNCGMPHLVPSCSVAPATDDNIEAWADHVYREYHTSQADALRGAVYEQHVIRHLDTTPTEDACPL